MNDPAVSGPTYPFVAGMMNYLGGVAQGEKFYEDLNNNGLSGQPDQRQHAGRPRGRHHQAGPGPELRRHRRRPQDARGSR